MSLRRILDFKIIQLAKYEVTLVDIISVIAIIVISNLFLKLVKKVIDRQLIGKRKLDVGRSSAFYQVVRYFIIVIAAIMQFTTSIWLFQVSTDVV